MLANRSHAMVPRFLAICAIPPSHLSKLGKLMSSHTDGSREPTRTGSFLVLHRLHFQARLSTLSPMKIVAGATSVLLRRKVSPQFGYNFAKRRLVKHSSEQKIACLHMGASWRASSFSV